MHDRPTVSHADVHATYLNISGVSEFVNVRFAENGNASYEGYEER
jgi:hypothetical protein